MNSIHYTKVGDFHKHIVSVYCFDVNFVSCKRNKSPVFFLFLISLPHFDFYMDFHRTPVFACDEKNQQSISGANKDDFTMFRCNISYYYYYYLLRCIIMRSNVVIVFYFWLQLLDRFKLKFHFNWFKTLSGINWKA